MQERVVVTGMGTVNPLGLNVSGIVEECNRWRIWREADHAV